MSVQGAERVRGASVGRGAGSVYTRTSASPAPSTVLNYVVLPL